MTWHDITGLRSPHKLKSAVSGCVRECAEAQGKDFGLVATENGYNLYVCGNGGAVARSVASLAFVYLRKSILVCCASFVVNNRGGSYHVKNELLQLTGSVRSVTWLPFGRGLEHHRYADVYFPSRVVSV